MRIDTEIEKIIVEIEDNEYPLADKTVTVAEKIIKAQKDMVGQPEYKLWLAMLEILLGKSAVKELFHDGKNENLDRLERVYRGVMKAFGSNSEKLDEEERQNKVEDLSGSLRPINEFMRQVNALNKSDSDKKIIHRS